MVANKIDRELLWKAWPEGYLAVKGISTVGGWICVDPNKPSRWLPMGGPRWEGDDNWPTEVASLFPEEFKIYQTNDLKYAHYKGDLLPSVNLEDAATWACLLRDLSKACGVPNRLDSPNYTWAWSRGTQEERDALGAPPFWRLTIMDLGGWTDRVFDIDTDDPALALVLARIQLREQNKHE